MNTIHSGEGLSLPEPDPDNITVLTRNLPNKPILPWNHYDSPWQEAEAEADAAEQELETIDSVEGIDQTPEAGDIEEPDPSEQLEETPTDTPHPLDDISLSG